MHESPARLFAVVKREVLELARRKTLFTMRFTFGACVSAVALMTLYSVLVSDGPLAGWQISITSSYVFAEVVALQSVLAVFMGVIMGANSSSSETANHTLGLLVLSRLRPWEVVVGKLIALLGMMVMVFLAAVPVLGVIGWSGGLDYQWLWYFALVSACYALLGISTGLMFGIRKRGGGAATVWGIAFLFAVFLLPFWIRASAPEPLARHWADLWIAQAASVVATQGRVPGFVGPVVVMLVLSLLLVLLAVRELPRAASRGAGRGLRGVFERLDRLFHRLNAGGLLLGGRKAPRMPVRNPVSWLTRTSGGFGLGRYALRLGVLNLSVTILLASWLAGRPEHEVLVVFFILLGLLSTLPIMTGANAIAGERSRKSLAVLLSTPLDGRKIVEGKTWPTLQLLVLAMTPPAAIVFVLIEAFAMNERDTKGMILFGSFFCVEALCGFVLALGRSLTARSALRAGIAGMALLLTVNLVPIFSAFIVHAAIQEERPWAVAMLVLLAIVTVLGGLSYGMPAGRRPRWLPEPAPARDLAGLLILVGLAIGGIVMYPIPGSSNLMDKMTDALSAYVSSDTAGSLLFMAYLVMLALVGYVYIVKNFDRACGRAP